MHHPIHCLSLSYSGDQSHLDGWCLGDGLLHLDVRVKDSPPPGGTKLGVVLADFISIYRFLVFQIVATFNTFVKRIKCFTNYGWRQLI